MRVAKVTSLPDGQMSTTFVDLPEFTAANAMAEVGKTINTAECDEIDFSQFNDGVLTMGYAQDKPFTWIRYTFVRVG